MGGKGQIIGIQPFVCDYVEVCIKIGDDRAIIPVLGEDEGVEIRAATATGQRVGPALAPDAVVAIFTDQDIGMFGAPDALNAVFVVRRSTCTPASECL